jgi:hypothetical protein
MQAKLGRTGAPDAPRFALIACVQCRAITKKEIIMTSGIKTITETSDFPRQRPHRLGFWSAVLTALFAAAAFAVGIATPARSGPYCASACVAYPYTNVAQFIPGDYVWLGPGILLALTFVMMMACIHTYASQDHKVYSRIGLSFALLYAAVMTTNYSIQFMVVIPSLLAGETTGLSLFTQYNPHGLFIGLEGIGYLMMSLAFLATAGVFSASRLERAIQGLFITNFVLAVGFLVSQAGLKGDMVAFEVAILTINWITLIIAGVLLSIVFKRAQGAI